MLYMCHVDILNTFPYHVYIFQKYEHINFCRVAIVEWKKLAVLLNGQ